LGSRASPGLLPVLPLIQGRLHKEGRFREKKRKNRNKYQAETGVEKRLPTTKIEERIKKK